VLADIPRSDGQVDKNRYDIKLLFRTVHPINLLFPMNTAGDGVTTTPTKAISSTLPTAVAYRSKNRVNKSVI